MKLPLKYIAILVILSLAGIFSYQAYWLGGLYRTMRNDLERNIIEAMRMSDYNEMMLRVERMRKDSADHGTVSVSAGFEKDGTQNKTYVHSTTSIDRNGRKEETSDQQVIHQKSDTLLMSISDNSSSSSPDKEVIRESRRERAGSTAFICTIVPIKNNSAVKKRRSIFILFKLNP